MRILPHPEDLLQKTDLKSLDLELSPQSQLAFVHLAAVGLVIIPAEMQSSVKNQLFDLVLEREFVFFRLPLCLLDRDDDIAEVRLIVVEFIGFMRKGKNIGCGIFSTEKSVEFFHSSI